jgi:NADPH-dependent F420 reductase
VRVAIVGGTGPFGRGLATRLAASGHDVTIGSRSEDRALEVAAELGVRGVANQSAAGQADLVVLAVDADAAVATATELRPFFAAPLLSVASQLEFADGTARPRSSGRSLAEEIAEIVDVPVAAGLHSLGARKLARSLPDEDAFVCGDEPEAKELALALADDVVAGRALDCGPLAAARGLEAMTAVLLNVNRRYKAHVGIRLTGLP